MRFAPHFTYSLVGLLLGAGAPVGSFLIRVLAILLEGADVAAALRVAEGIVTHLGASAPQREPVTVTIGICAAARPSLSHDLFGEADRALLAGKAHGRNTIEVVAI